MSENGAVGDRSGAPWVRTLVIIVVILAAASVAAYSLLRGPATVAKSPGDAEAGVTAVSGGAATAGHAAAGDCDHAGGTPCVKSPSDCTCTAHAGSAGSGDDTCPKAATCEKAMAAAEGKAPCASMQAADKPSGSPCAGMSELKGVEKLVGDRDAVFVILPGKHGPEAASVSREVEAVVAKLADRGKKVAAVTLERDADEYDHLVAQASVKSLPAVVALGRSGQFMRVTGEMTEEKLARAFVVASMPAPNCGSGCASAKGCGMK